VITVHTSTQKSASMYSTWIKNRTVYYLFYVSMRVWHVL